MTALTKLPSLSRLLQLRLPTGQISWHSLSVVPQGGSTPLPSTLNSFSSFSLNTNTTFISLQYTVELPLYLSKPLVSLPHKNLPPPVPPFRPPSSLCLRNFKFSLCPLPLTKFFIPTTLSSDVSWISTSIGSHYSANLYSYLQSVANYLEVWQNCSLLDTR